MQCVKKADNLKVMAGTEGFARLAHHRSKRRIQTFGEVWTPARYVRQMLDMLEKSVWTDLNVVFFEPTCGHGNFVEAIAQRRLKALLSKAKKQRIKQPHFYAAANTLNNLWAVDIDPKNISFCQDRIWTLVFDFLWVADCRPSTKSSSSLKSFIKKHKDFLAQALCCIEWQIQENEALSCLESDPKRAILAAQKTAVSRKWIQKNRHRPIDFNKTWLWRFEALRKSNIAPIEYIRNLKKLDSLAEGEKQSVFKKSRILNQTDFLKRPIEKHEKKDQSLLRAKFDSNHCFPKAA